MDTFIGIDGIRGGWVAAYIDEARALRFDYASALDRLLAVPHSRAMIDIPIGLPKRGYRLCDLEARHVAGSSVFLGARWNLWTFQSHKKANESYWANDDKGVSIQLWNIRAKLQEVNEAMTPIRQLSLMEAHPEVIFWRLNNKTRLERNKKSDEGRRQRIDLLTARGFNEIGKWLGELRSTGIGRDDLLDACACALAARDHSNKFPNSEAQLDDRGLRMEIWY